MLPMHRHSILSPGERRQRAEDLYADLMERARAILADLKVNTELLENAPYRAEDRLWMLFSSVATDLEDLAVDAREAEKLSYAFTDEPDDC